MKKKSSKKDNTLFRCVILSIGYALCLMLFVNSSVDAQVDQSPDSYYNPLYAKNVNASALLEDIADVTSNIVDEDKRAEINGTYGSGKLKIAVDSIEPQAGPTTGTTNVLVRGGPFDDLALIYPHPKCKFGRMDMVVDATYVPCVTTPLGMKDLEPTRKEKVSFTSPSNQNIFID